MIVCFTLFQFTTLIFERERAWWEMNEHTESHHTGKNLIAIHTTMLYIKCISAFVLHNIIHTSTKKGRQTDVRSRGKMGKCLSEVKKLNGMAFTDGWKHGF